MPTGFNHEQIQHLWLSSPFASPLCELTIRNAKQSPLQINRSGDRRVTITSLLVIRVSNTPDLLIHLLLEGRFLPQVLEHVVILATTDR